MKIDCRKANAENKEENVKFYTQKCFFDIDAVEMDGNVKVFRFVRERG